MVKRDFENIDSENAGNKNIRTLEPRGKFRFVQTNLNNIIRETEFGLKQKIINTCIILHKLTIHAYQFINLYSIHLLKNGLSLKKISKKFITDILRMIARSIDPISRSRQKKFDSELQKFFDEQYNPTMIPEVIDTAWLHQSFNFIASDILKNIEVNIQQHYKDYLKRLIEVLYLDRHKDKQLLADHEIRSNMSRDKNAVLFDQLELVPENSPIFHYRHLLLPQNHEIEKHVAYDIKNLPQKYLPCMYLMLQVIEEFEGKMYSLFPMRNSIIPKAMRIDTTLLIERFLSTEDLIHHGLVHSTKNELTRGGKGSLTDAKDKIWASFFKTELHCFAPRKDTPTYREPCQFVFGHSIITDGIKCTVQQKLRDDSERFYAVKEKFSQKDQHIDSLAVNLEELQGMNVVGIDPGKQDLLFCVMPRTIPKIRIRTKRKKKRKQRKPKDRAYILRYSAAQRNRECKTKYQRRRMERAVDGADLIEGKTVKQWQHELSFVQRKTVDFETLKAYITKKNLINSKLMKFWSQEQFRKMNWQSKINRQRSESKFMNRFRDTFGGPDHTVVTIGDWKEGQPRPFQQPTKGVEFRKMFKRAGYKVFLVNEFRTSMMSHCCHTKTITMFHKIRNFRRRPSGETRPCSYEQRCNGCLERDQKYDQKGWNKPRKPYKEQIKCHGLLMCKTCEKFWNRDLNGALNIQLVAASIINGEGRPEYLSRPTRQAAVPGNNLNEIEQPVGPDVFVIEDTANE